MSGLRIASLLCLAGLFPSTGRAAGLPLATARPGYAHQAWEPLSITGRIAHASAYDSKRQRAVIYAGTSDSDYLSDASALLPGVERSWKAIGRRGGEIPPRCEGATLVYDSLRDRLLAFGGMAVRPREPGPGLTRVLGDRLWQLSLESDYWTPVPIQGLGPQGRWDHASIYDPVRDRVLIFGGTNYFNLGLSDLWEFVADRDTAWKQLEQSGDIPPPGLQGMSHYDSTDDLLILTAGARAWTLTLTPPYQWHALATRDSTAIGAGPTVLDAEFNRLLAPRGARLWTSAIGDTLDWRPLTTTGTGPAGISGYSATWNPVARELVLFGGSNGCDEVATTWVLSLSTDPPHWSEVASPGPELAGHESILDSRRGRIISVGGFSNQDVLQLDVETGRWSTLATSGGDPGIRDYHTAVFDPESDQIVVFGGKIEGGVLSRDQATWGLQLSSTPALWTQLTQSDSPIPALTGSSGVYDTNGRRVLAFGGLSDSLSNDVWEFRPGSEPTWSRLQTAEPRPSPRVLAAAAYDSLRNRALFYGGTDESGGLNDLWALELSGTARWVLISDQGLIHGYEPCAIYAPARDQLVVADPERQQLVAYNSWGSWTYLVGMCCGAWDPSPSARGGASMVYDPERDALIETGGYRGVPCLPRRRASESWWYAWGEPLRLISIDVVSDSRRNLLVRGNGETVTVTLLGTPTVDITTVVPQSLSFAGAPVLWTDRTPRIRVVDRKRDGVLDLEADFAVDATHLAPGDSFATVLGQGLGFSVRGSGRVQVVAYTPPPKTPSPPNEESLEFQIAGWQIESGGKALRVAVTLPVVGRARLDVYDICGRRAAAQIIDPPSAGHYEFVIEEHRRLRNGIYVIQVTQGARSASRKVALTP